MSEIKIKLTGWKALVALVVVAGFLGYRYYALHTTVATEAADELRFWLAAEYIAAGLPALEEAVESGDAVAAELQAQEILARERIEFTEISARGSADDVVVRVELLVDGRAPPVGKPVRFFRMKHSMVTGWRMQREVHAISYYLRFI